MNKPTQKDRFAISDLAKEFSISTRTIRFYEEKGLILPARSQNGRRVYDRRDRARIKLILRGKRFGYTLAEIIEMIGRADDEIDERDQIMRSLAYGEKNLEKYHRRIQEMTLLKEEITKLRARLLERLAELDAKGEEKD